MKEAHLIGNGSTASLFDHNSDGRRLTCNLPPFPVHNAIGTCMVDFKMMYAINEGSVVVPGDWILGYRPKHYMSTNPGFYMKYAQQVKEFYLTLPKYVPNYTDLSCGHMACHYLATKHKPDMIHMYGFDSIFDFDLRSCTDFYLQSNRDAQNTVRLTNNWRNIWPSMFAEFGNVQFKLHGKHESVKIDLPPNVSVVVHKK